jgi:hypothetical protein
MPPLYQLILNRHYYLLYATLCKNDYGSGITRENYQKDSDRHEFQPPFCKDQSEAFLCWFFQLQK